MGDFPSDVFTIKADGGQLRTCATSYGTKGSTCSTAASDLRAIDPNWSGDEQRVFKAKVSTLPPVADKASTAMTTIKKALDDFAADVDSAQQQMSTLRASAQKTWTAREKAHTDADFHRAPLGVPPLVKDQKWTDDQNKLDAAASALDTTWNSDVTAAGTIKSGLADQAKQTAAKVHEAATGVPLLPQDSPPAAPGGPSPFDVANLSAGWFNSIAGLLTSIPAGVAGYDLLKYFTQGPKVLSDLDAMENGLIQDAIAALKTGSQTPEQIAARMQSALDAWDAFAPDVAKWGEAAKARWLDGGLTDALNLLHMPAAEAVAKWGGRGLGVLGIAGDVMTIISPDGTGAEATVNRIAAGANAVGTAAVMASPLLAANAALDWVPGVGEVVMVGTAVYLAGDFLYNHWQPAHDFMNGVADTAKDIGGDIADGAKKAWDWLTS